MKFFKDNRGIAHLAIFIVVAVIAIGFVAWVSWNSYQTNKNEDSTRNVASATLSENFDDRVTIDPKNFELLEEGTGCSVGGDATVAERSYTEEDFHIIVDDKALALPNQRDHVVAMLCLVDRPNNSSLMQIYEKYLDLDEENWNYKVKATTIGGDEALIAEGSHESSKRALYLIVNEHSVLYMYSPANMLEVSDANIALLEEVFETARFK